MVKIGDKLRLSDGRRVEVVYLHKQHVFMIDLENDAACIDLKDNLRDAKVVTTKWYNLYRSYPGGAYYDSEEEAVNASLFKKTDQLVSTLSVEI